MPDVDGGDFYVGYAPAMPPGLRRFVGRAVAGALAGAGTIALAAALAQGPFAPGVFEYGVERELVGWVREAPAPLLIVPGPVCTEWCAPTASWLLARYGTKRGAEDLVRGLDGRLVRLRGALVHRAGDTLLDVVPGSLEPISEGVPGGPPASAPPARVEELGVHTLAGEIVDGKCHLGVMRPGEGKAHRACAARCIASGSPALLWVHDGRGEERQLLLLGADGRALRRELLPWIGEPVEITGRVQRYDGLLVLRADPAGYRRR